MPKTVLITGGSSGVGAELVSLFAERGYIVWFTYNSGRQRADKLLETLPKNCSAQVTCRHRGLAKQCTHVVLAMASCALHGYCQCVDDMDRLLLLDL